MRLTPFGSLEPKAPMHTDVDLLRDLLFDLATRQTSPPSTLKIGVDAEAIALGFPARAVEAGLSRLLELDYIDGPGEDVPGFFLFRTLTRKGTQFVRTTRAPQDWARLKRHFAALGADPSALRSP